MQQPIHSYDRPRIMLVEDNPADVDLIEEALTEDHIDCELYVIRDGDKAIATIEQVDADTERLCPDLMLLDLNLPKVGGEEILKRVRSSQKFRNVKVLIISSSSAPSDRERAMRLGATDYFRKPSRLDQFMELGPRVRSLLRMPEVVNEGFGDEIAPS